MGRLRRPTTSALKPLLGDRFRARRMTAMGLKLHLTFVISMTASKHYDFSI